MGQREEVGGPLVKSLVINLLTDLYAARELSRTTAVSADDRWRPSDFDLTNARHCFHDRGTAN